MKKKGGHKGSNTVPEEIVQTGPSVDANGYRQHFAMQPYAGYPAQSAYPYQGAPVYPNGYPAPNAYPYQGAPVYPNGYPAPNAYPYQGAPVSPNGYPAQSSSCQVVPIYVGGYPTQNPYPYPSVPVYPSYPAQPNYIVLTGCPYQKSACSQPAPRPVITQTVQPRPQPRPLPPPAPQPKPQPQPQPQPVQTAQPVTNAATATPAELEALISTQSSRMMLLACILFMVNLILSIAFNVLNRNLVWIYPLICDAIILTGMWLTYSNGKKRVLARTGITLMKIPYTVGFVFEVIKFAISIYVCIYMTDVLNLFLSGLSFVFCCACFATVYRALSIAGDISRNKATGRRTEGTFAAVCIIVFAALTLFSAVAGYFVFVKIMASLDAMSVPYLASVLNLGEVLSTTPGVILNFAMAAVSFLTDIFIAIVFISFEKKLKKAKALG